MSQRVDPYIALPSEMDPAVRRALIDVLRSHAKQINWATGQDSVTITTSTTVAQDLVLANATGGQITCTLPKAIDWQDRTLHVKKIDGSTNVIKIVAQSGEKIDDTATASISAQYSTAALLSDGAAWWIIQSGTAGAGGGGTTVTTTTYGTPGTVTWTMTAAASDTTLLNGRESTAVSNAANKYLDVLIGGSFTGPAASAAIGLIEIYAYGSWDGGTTYSSDMTATDSDRTLVASSKLLLKPITAIPTTATNGDIYKWGPYSLADIFGRVPEEWGLWGVHDAGASLQASTTKYTGITETSA